MRSRTLLVLAGVAIGVGGTLFVTGPSLTPAVAAGQGGGRPVGTYQISAYPSGPGGTSGAYIVDTTSGEVFWVSGRSQPTSLGVPQAGK